MGRPKGSLNKQKTWVASPAQLDSPIPQTVATLPVVPMLNQPPAIRYDALFGIRNLRSGPFKGLWELVKLDQDGKRFVITDANSRGSIISLITKQILKIVIQG